jgi:trimeric autotransporter adhesin
LDTAGNALTGASWSYSKNSTAVPVTLSSAQVANGGVTNSPSVAFTATFNEGVSGFTTSDVTVIGGSINSFVQVNPSTYTFNIAPTSTLVSVRVPAGVANAVAAPNNPNAASATYQFTFDAAPPTVVAITPSKIGPTNDDNTSFTVTFSEPVSDFDDVSDVIVNHSGTAHAGLTITPTSSTQYTVTVNGITGDGTISISIAAGAVKDTANNTNAAAGPSPTVTIDNAAPVASAPTDAGTTTTNPLVTFNWSAPTDNLSGVANVVLQVGTTPGGNDLFNAAVSGTSAQVSGTHGQTLYARLIVTDNAGNVTTTANSNGILILSPGNTAVVRWESYESLP